MGYNNKIFARNDLKNQREIEVTIKVDEVFGAKTAVSVVGKDEKVIGGMIFSVKESCIHIIRMNNYTHTSSNPLKHIGSLLLEYAFRISIERGKGGRVELDTKDDSPASFFLMGLRARAALIDEELRELIDRYEQDKSATIIANIKTHDDFKFLSKNAARCSVLHQCPDIFDKNKTDWYSSWDKDTRIESKNSVISFDEIMQWGYESFNNLLFAEYIKTKLATGDKARITKEDCRRGGMDGVFMFLPARTIAEWKIKYGLSSIQNTQQKAVLVSNTSPLTPAQLLQKLGTYPDASKQLDEKIPGLPSESGPDHNPHSSKVLN